MPSFLNQLLGSKPTVPDLPKLDLGTEAGKAIAANQKNLPAAESLVASTNKFTEQQIQQMLEQAVPGYSKMVQTATANIGSELKGELPADVVQQIQDKTAASALGGGFAGSGMHADLTARDLGLTSLQLTQQGLSSFESWTKTAASLFEPSMMNVQSMFISPMQEYQTDNEQNVQQFQRQWMQNQIDAQPAMWAQAFKEAVQTAISMYSHSSGGIQHAGTLPVQGSAVTTVSAAGGEGGASFSPGGQDYSTSFVDTTGASNDPGNELGAGGGFGGFGG